MRRKPKADPLDISDQDRITAELARFERAYGRMRRALSIMESARQAIRRAKTRIRKRAEVRDEQATCKGEDNGNGQ